MWFKFRKRHPFDPLEHVLFPWDKDRRDNFALRDLVAGGVAIFGRSGSGKTSASGKRLMNGIAHYDNSGLLVCAATREDLGQVSSILKAAGRERQLIVFSPDGKARCNFLNCIAKTGGGPHEVTKFFAVIRQSLENGDSKGGENQKFFEDEQNRGIFNATVILQLATGEVSAPLLHRFLSDMAQTPEQLKDPQWRQGFHCEMLRRAQANARTAREQNDFSLAMDYFANEMPNIDSKTRSNIYVGIFSLLHLMLGGVIRDMISGETTFSPDDLFKRRWIVCDMPPNVWGDAGKLVNVGLKYLTQRAILGRNVQPGDPVVGIWCDEFQQFVSGSGYDAHYLATCRSRLGFLVALTQSVSGLYTALRQAGKHQTHALLSNFSHCIFHACDPETAEYAVSKLGKQLTTFIGGSMAPQGDLYDDLFGTPKFTGNFSESYSEVLQTQVLMTGMRTGGPACNYLVDSICIKNGVPFADGQAWKWVTWRQR